MSLSSLQLRVFVNVGTKGNPEFEVDASGALGVRALPWIAMNSTDKLAEFTLDVPPPVDALSATTNATALLVSDSEGRIWYYQQPTTSNQLPTTNHQLPTPTQSLGRLSRGLCAGVAACGG